MHVPGRAAHLVFGQLCQMIPVRIASDNTKTILGSHYSLTRMSCHLAAAPTVGSKKLRIML